MGLKTTLLDPIPDQVRCGIKLRISHLYLIEPLATTLRIGECKSMPYQRIFAFQNLPDDDSRVIRHHDAHGNLVSTPVGGYCTGAVIVWLKNYYQYHNRRNNTRGLDSTRPNAAESLNASVPYMLSDAFSYHDQLLPALTLKNLRSDGAMIVGPYTTVFTYMQTNLRPGAYLFATGAHTMALVKHGDSSFLFFDPDCGLYNCDSFTDVQQCMYANGLGYEISLSTGPQSCQIVRVVPSGGY
jgi:hypothetical protein